MRYLSLFDGIGAASVAWEPLGWECVGVSEVDPFPIAVTKHHRPNVPHLGDVTKITEAQIAAMGRIDLIVGGFPCQDLSVAGKRAGLRNDDGTVTRSGLFFDAIRLVQWARKHCGLRWLLIENVPGLYSSNGGRDFASVVGSVVGADFDVPRDGWRNAGIAVGPEGKIEWCTLDAQYFNLAQRRVRVFALGDFGDWRSAPPVFSLAEGLSGHPAPRREAGENTAVCPTLRAGGNSTGGHRPPGTDVDTCDSREVAPTLRSMGHDGSHANAGGQVAVAFHNRQDPDVSGGVTHPLGAKDNGLAAHIGMQVRRLTPRECERLQGFPDDYTLIEYRNRPAADGPRYKALGNSMAVPCMAWIGRRIAAVEALRHE